MVITRSARTGLRLKAFPIVNALSNIPFNIVPKI